jgi:hypothetical protein
MRDGKLNNSEFGIRMSGEGKIAESIEQLFRSATQRAGLNETKPNLTTNLFVKNSNQFEIF